MNLRSLTRLLLLTAPLLGCDARGISVGTEELCVADPNLLEAQATSTERVSSCARIGENQLLNGDFELPLVACFGGSYCQFPAAEVEGWQTDSASQVIEIWQDGHMGVPSSEGDQFVELNAHSQDTLSQDITTRPGQLLYWSLLHRGRNGRESVEVRIGPPNATTSQAILRSAADAWYPYRGLYRTGEAEVVTRIELDSRTGTLEGNLIDAVVLAPVD
jgi:hypothetical protein